MPSEPLGKPWDIFVNRAAALSPLERGRSPAAGTGGKAMELQQERATQIERTWNMELSWKLWNEYIRISENCLMNVVILLEAVWHHKMGTPWAPRKTHTVQPHHAVQFRTDALQLRGGRWSHLRPTGVRPQAFQKSTTRVDQTTYKRTREQCQCTVQNDERTRTGTARTRTCKKMRSRTFKNDHTNRELQFKKEMRTGQVQEEHKITSNTRTATTRNTTRTRTRTSQKQIAKTTLRVGNRTYSCAHFNHEEASQTTRAR